jgi:rRNA maturation RNase YbeY
MMVVLTNAQRDAPVNTARMGRLARQAVRALRIRTRGTLAITFIGASRMRALNKRFLRHDRLTDVLSFRYDGEPVVGEIFIAPRAARAYAKRHGLAYAGELARYVVHGLLHWLGHEDRTPKEQRMMRSREDRLLSRCGVA